MSKYCPYCKDNEILVWYARAGHNLRLGPFKTQLEAFEVTRHPAGGHYDNSYVWAEKLEDAKIRDLPWEERLGLYKKKDK